MDSSSQPTVDTPETLAAVLGARARRTPGDRLAIDIAGGLLVAAAAIWARPPGWFPLVAASVCLASYGCWAFSERRAWIDAAQPPAALSAAWRAARQASAALGLAAFVTLLFALLGVALGPMIS